MIELRDAWKAKEVSTDEFSSCNNPQKKKVLSPALSQIFFLVKNAQTGNAN